MESNATKYEIIKKTDTSFIIPVDGMEFGDRVVTAKTSVGDVVFNNALSDGNLENEEWLIREVGTHAQADGTGTVEVAPEVVPTVEVAPEVVPTVEVAPEVVPTVEVAPEVVPTVEVAPEVVPTVEGQ